MGLLLRTIAWVLPEPDVIDDIHVITAFLLTNGYDQNISLFRNLSSNPIIS